MTEKKLDFKLTPAQRRKSMTCAIVTASFSVVTGACMFGNVLTLVALKLGAQEIFIGVLTFFSLAPFFCGVFTMSAIERTGKRRNLLFWWSITSVLMGLFLLVPIVADHWPAKASLALLLATVVLVMTAGSFAATAWFPMMQDIVPLRITGRFFARIRTLWQTASLITFVFVSWLLRDNPAWWKFEVLFIIAVIASLARIVSALPITEKPPLPEHVNNTTSIISRFIEIFKEKRLRIFIFYLFSYNFALIVCEPFKIKLLSDLGYSSGFIIAASSVMISIGAIISLRSWGKLADKFGNHAIFGISHIGMILITLLWLLVGKSVFGSVLIFSLYFLWSIFQSGNGIAGTRYMLHAVPSTKQNYINIINILAVLTMAVAPLIGGLFLTLTKNFSLQCGTVNFNNYQLLFVLAAIMFIVPHTLRKNLKSKKETSAIEVLAVVTRPVRRMLGPFVKLNKRNPTSGHKDS